MMKLTYLELELNETNKFGKNMYEQFIKMLQNDIFEKILFDN